MPWELKEWRKWVSKLFFQLPSRPWLWLHKQKSLFKVAKEPPLRKLKQNSTVQQSESQTYYFAKIRESEISRYDGEHEVTEGMRGLSVQKATKTETTTASKVRSDLDAVITACTGLIHRAQTQKRVSASIAVIGGRLGYGRAKLFGARCRVPTDVET